MRSWLEAPLTVIRSQESASASSIEVGIGRGRPFQSPARQALRLGASGLRSRGEFGGDIGGDSYSFSVPMGSGGLRADDVMGGARAEPKAKVKPKAEVKPKVKAATKAATGRGLSRSRWGLGPRCRAQDHPRCGP